MDVHTLSAVLAVAVTGYGEVQDGRPSWGQREMHVYTNLVRVDPMAWEGDYPCAVSSFTSSEKTPKDPLLYHDGLAEIAQLHSEDMAAHHVMTHDSSDGSSFSDRVGPYYGGWTLAENVAAGYADNASAVWDGWMCSSGHRSNIMNSGLTDLGTGEKDAYYTQDFGGGAGASHRSIAMGVHVPERPTNTVTFLATWDDDAPTSLAVETDDACIEMELLVGDDSRGGWQASASAASGCVPYRFRGEKANGSVETLPETGSYQYGQGCDLWISTPTDACDPAVDTGDAGDSGDSGDAGDAGTDGGDTGDGAGDCPEPDRDHDCQPDAPKHAGASDDATLTGCNALGGAGRAGQLPAGQLPAGQLPAGQLPAGQCLAGLWLALLGLVRRGR